MRSFSMTSRTTWALNSSEYFAAGLGSILSTHGKKNSPCPRNTTHSTPTPQYQRKLTTSHRKPTKVSRVRANDVSPARAIRQHHDLVNVSIVAVLITHDLLSHPHGGVEV